MRRGGLFWGMVLLLLGGLLLLANFNVLPFDVWRVFWPLLLILLGVWVLLGLVWRGPRAEVERVAVPLEGIERARVVIDHGIGIATLSGPAEPGMLLSGEFSGGVDVRVRRDGAAATLTMKMAARDIPFFFPWGEGSEYRWNFGLSKDIPLVVEIEGGAGRWDFDMRALRVTELDVDGGVGTAALTLPAAAGHTSAKVEAGVGTMHIRIPEGVAARIKTSGGLGTITVSQGRFPLVGEHSYQSPNYDTAENRVDLRVEGGVGTITIS